MTGSSFGRIAQLLYANGQELDFMRLAGDLHRSLSRLDESGLPLRWDGDGLASIDLPSVRIVLGFVDHPGSGHSACLTVAVEPCEGGSHPAASAGFEETCVSLVDHLNRSFPAVAILWHHAHEPLTNALHDRLIAALPLLTQPFCDPAQQDIFTTGSESTGPLDVPCAVPDAAPSLVQGPVHAKRVTRKSLARSANANRSARARAMMARTRGRTHFTAPAKSDQPVTVIGNDFLPKCEKFDMEFAPVRRAFICMDPDPPVPHPSAAMRVTTHVLNASLVLVWPPLGAAVIAHSLITGESTRFSGYIVVLTGLVGVALDTRVGQYMAAIAGA